MKAVLQRVTSASVTVADAVVGEISHGLLVLLCAEKGDISDDVSYFARKIANMRLFEDESGKTNLSINDVGGAILAVSQFTLAADWRKGNRPGFSGAELPERATELFDIFCDELRNHGLTVETGKFGAAMEVSLVNDGPFTIVMDSRA